MRVAIMLTTTEAAEVAAVAPSTIKRWADQGILPFSRTAGGPAFPGPAPFDSFYGEPPVAEPSGSIGKASCQRRRGPCGPNRRGRCDSGGPQETPVAWPGGFEPTAP